MPLAAAFAPVLFIHASAFALITVTDDLGRRVTLEHPAARIVSLAPSITECLFAIGAGSRLAGVTDFCNYPPEAAARTHVGGMINPSLEAIVALRPDLIVLSMEGNMRADFDRLTTLGAPVFVTNPRTLDGIYLSLEELGTLAGTADSARALVRKLRARESAARDAVKGMPPVRVIAIVSLSPLICVGAHTFIDELLTAAGGTNIARRGSGTYPAYSREQVIADDPEAIIVMSDALAAGASLEKVFPEWASLAALKQHRVFRLDGDMLARPGPRAIDALELLVHYLHSPQ
ncbi:MAG TPA: cobalamin-binding protein [Bacteroidota bacterium]|nr:cobalamin-binding protein [Bacteroidota bacterium]